MFDFQSGLETEGGAGEVSTHPSPVIFTPGLFLGRVGSGVGQWLWAKMGPVQEQTTFNACIATEPRQMLAPLSIKRSMRNRKFPSRKPEVVSI